MRTIEEIRQLLLELSACTGVSGDEGGIAKKIEELLRPAADCRRTPLGNVIAVQNAGAPKKLMTAAHMDEVGYLITYIEDSGLLRFTPVGGVSPEVMAGKRVYVGQKLLPGLVGLKAVHQQKAAERTTSTSTSAQRAGKRPKPPSPWATG